MPLPAERQIPVAESQQRPSFLLSWRAYFLEFCKEHGGDPVHHGGMLLFRDGWRYSAVDYRGPELRPPAGEELRQLKLAYWRRRVEVVRLTRERLYARTQQLHDAKESRSVPLQTIVRAEDGYRTATVDWTILGRMLKRADLDLAKAELEVQQLETTV